MDRLLMNKLLEWKRSPRRKPLLLEGVRQCGKTWIAQKFGKNHFAKCAYVSLLDNPRLEAAFAGSIDPDHLVRVLSIESGVGITPADTLVVLDEVQEVPRALTALKYFCEEAPQYAVLATGSSLGVTLHQGASFPVGKVDLLRLYPLSFCEFLQACGKGHVAEALLAADLELAGLFHDDLLEHLALYMLTGGMPEVVSKVAADLPSVDFQAVQSIQDQILAGYRMDFSRHEDYMPRGLPVRLNQVWDSMPAQLTRENRRFLYGAVRSGGRGRDFELAIQWLADMSLALKVCKAKPPTYPLRMNAQPDLFKLFMPDVGLLARHAGMDARGALDPAALFGRAKGAIAEQFVCQQLVGLGISPFYWQADNSSNELDFVIQAGGQAVPVEVKSGINLRSKSLKACIQRFGYQKALRFSRAKGGRDGAIVDLPLYAVESLPALLERSDLFAV